MTANYSWTAILLSFAALLGILSVAILLFNRKRYMFFIEPLIIHLAVSTFWVLHRMLIETRLILEVPHFFRAVSPFVLLAGPTLYLYVRSLIKSEMGWRKQDWIHFLPGAVVLLTLFPFLIKNISEKRNWLEMLYSDPSLFGQFLESILPPYFQHVLNGLIVLGYSLAAFTLLLKYLKDYSDDQRFLLPGTVRWIFFHSSVALILGLITLGSFVFEQGFNIYFVTGLNFIAGIFMLTTFLLLFFNPAILYGLSDKEFKKLAITKSNGVEKILYGLDKTRMNEIKKQLREYLETPEVLLDRNLTLSKLADGLKVSRHQLSYVINRYYEVNFNDFINNLRIEYCLNEIFPEEWKTYTIEGLGYKLGFGNRGTFTKAFKKKTGKLPSEYRKSLLCGE